MNLTRRTFVKRTAALGAGLALAEVPALALFRQALASESSTAGVSPEEHPAVLYDITRCLGCYSCVVACQVNKRLPPDVTLIDLVPPDTSAVPEAERLRRRHQCMTCLHPACVSVCPVGALVKAPEGPVVYEDERCIGCRYCMNACPFNAPGFDWDRNLAEGPLIRKCDFCYDRLKQGKLPACVEACPSGAVIFGKRAELLAEARSRIQAHPEKYVDHIYGETEAGGTSFLTLSPIPFKEFGLPSPGDRPLQLVTEKIMVGTVPFALAWTTVLGGITALTHMRARRMEQHPPEPNAAGPERRADDDNP